MNKHIRNKDERKIIKHEQHIIKYIVIDCKNKTQAQAKTKHQQSNAHAKHIKTKQTQNQKGVGVGGDNAQPTP